MPIRDNPNRSHCDHVQAVGRSPKTDFPCTACIHYDNVSRLDLVAITDVPNFVEPGPVCSNNLFGGIQFPHWTVGRDTTKGESGPPESHTVPKWSNFGSHQSSVKVPNPIHPVTDISDTKIFVKLA
jgi:hypothetical protein